MKRGRGSESDDREATDLYVHAISDNSVLVSADGDEDQSTWLPKSKVDTEDGGPYRRGPAVLLVPQWLLEKEGLC